jgi:hypothetical protein
MSAFAVILTVVWMTLSVKTVSAQGLVSFRNDVLPSPPDRLVRDSSGSAVVGTNFVAELLYETSQGSFTVHPVPATFRPATTQFPGTWFGGDRTLQGAGGIDVPVRMQVRAWDAGLDGMTFEEAVDAGRKWGVSELFVYTERESILPNPRDKWMWEFRSFQLVPEPSTWALSAAGVGFLFWRWRRS